MIECEGCWDEVEKKFDFCPKCQKKIEEDADPWGGCVALRLMIDKDLVNDLREVAAQIVIDRLEQEDKDE